MIIINLAINSYNNNNNNNNNGDIFTKQTPASKLFVLTVPFLYWSYMETFFLYIQREIELCSMVYPALIPNAMLNDRSSSKREAIIRCNI